MRRIASLYILVTLMVIGAMIGGCGEDKSSSSGCQSGYHDCGNFCCKTGYNCCWTAKVCCPQNYPWYCGSTKLCYSGALPPSFCSSAELCGIVSNQTGALILIPGQETIQSISDIGVPPSESACKD